MLHHISIAVENPQHVAEVLAELWGGCAYPFPIYPNSYIAFAGDAHGTAIEVYPIGSELMPGRPDLPDLQLNQSGSKFSATHAAISVPLNQQQIEQIAQREGWQAQLGDRGPFFQVVELWVENSILLELLTPEMAARYVAFSTPENWEKLVLAATSV
ncbi:hypothetical protein ACF3DV_10160 [Chlorogloeopsis fritschii PCC 9212]|uniref:VOC domain-containing protein n=1 Tax=Chlorogloeopsis fritschii PCC 6912 TaxID=211165 RepID=A0A3S0YL71_CHLFR|nr:hypothetical protein [Chlorogloeopsis fritschii]RUR87004.1 hypothetical protein PCC6912_04470 [Chlorogloeopsis fritschii PCC 6912]